MLGLRSPALTWVRCSIHSPSRRPSPTTLPAIHADHGHTQPWAWIRLPSAALTPFWQWAQHLVMLTWPTPAQPLRALTQPAAGAAPSDGIVGSSQLSLWLKFSSKGNMCGAFVCPYLHTLLDTEEQLQAWEVRPGLYRAIQHWCGHVLESRGGGVALQNFLSV